MLLGRVSLGLLRWWLLRLIELSIQAAQAREWWLGQRRRPTSYLIWCGPRHWLRHGPLGRGDAVVGAGPHASWSAPLRVLETTLQGLTQQLLRLARRIGRLRHCLSALDHAESDETLRSAVAEAINLVAVLVAEHSAEHSDKHSAQHSSQHSAQRRHRARGRVGGDGRRAREAVG